MAPTDITLVSPYTGTQIAEKSVILLEFPKNEITESGQFRYFNKKFLLCVQK